MIIPLDDNISDIFNNNIGEVGIDFNLSRELYKEEDSLLTDLFTHKEESLFDLFRNKSFSKEAEFIYNIANVIKQESKKVIEQDNSKKITPEYFALNKIKELIYSKLTSKIIKEFEQKIFMENNIQKIESEKDIQVLIGKKRKKKDKLKYDVDDKRDIGRKKKENIIERKHNKYCADNIIKKIKLKLLEGFLKFVNKVINESLNKSKLIEYNKVLRNYNKNIDKSEDLLKMIDYKYIDRLNKKKDLSLLYMPFKELFSKEVSPRYSTLKPDSNRIIIEKLIKEEDGNENIDFALNLKFKDWIDVFTYKKGFKSIINLQNENLENLIEYFEYADNLILDIYRINPNDNYLLYFIIYLYNYERWFCLKAGRTRTSKRTINKII